MATHSSILAWRITWTEEPGGLQSMGLQSQTLLSDFHLGFPGGSVEKESAAMQATWVRSLEEGVATHSSILENPRTEEPGGLQSTGSQRVRHN